MQDSLLEQDRDLRLYEQVCRSMISEKEMSRVSLFLYKYICYAYIMLLIHNNGNICLLFYYVCVAAGEESLG